MIPGPSALWTPADDGVEDQRGQGGPNGVEQDEGEAGAAKFNCTLAKNKGQRVKHEDECDYCAQWNEGEELCTCPGGLAIAAAKPAAKHELCSRPRLQVPLHEIDLTQFSHLEPHLAHTGAVYLPRRP